MTKRSDALAQAVARSSPGFASRGSFLYRQDPVLMLRGFAFDMPPGVCYVWKYYIPLFSEVDFLNMSLGYRIPNGYIETKGRSSEEVTNMAIAIVNENNDFAEKENINEIILFAKNSLISSFERSKLFRDIECFQDESLDDVLKRAAINLEKVGI